MPNININIDKINEIEYNLPASVGGVVTLLAGKTYLLSEPIDLLGDRIVAGGVCNLFGTSSETASITSTGLGVGVPLLTSDFTIVLESITIKNVDTAIAIDGNVNLVALDWRNVNFENVPNVGVINTCDNFIFDTSAFLGAQGLTFTGTIGTVAMNNSLFRGLGSAGKIIELDASCTITRRFRIIYSSVVAFGSTVGIDVNTSTTIPVEAYILDTVNFSGGSSYLSGVDNTNNKALFVNCVGITNTAVNGQLFMQNNATATTISNTSDFFKIEGTTTASPDNAKFTHSDNRLTCDAVIQRKYLIQCTLSFAAGATNVCEFGFYDSQLVAVRTPSRTKATANAGGRAENVNFVCVVSMKQGDFLEVWAKNTSATTNITVDQLNFVITEIK
jgi:hypothetical protein